MERLSEGTPRAMMMVSLAFEFSVPSTNRKPLLGGSRMGWSDGWVFAVEKLLIVRVFSRL